MSARVGFTLNMLTALLLSSPIYGGDVVVASSGDVTVNEQDILLALAPVAEEKRSSIVSNPKLMSQLIERVLFNRILASQVTAAAEIATTDESPLARDARLADAYMAKVVASPPDFSRLAAERYAVNPRQEAVSASKQVQLLHVEGKELAMEFAERYSFEEFTKLASALSTTIKDLKVPLDRPQDFEAIFWEAVGQLQTPGDTKAFRDNTATFVVRLQAVEQSRLRNREEAISLIVGELEAEWKKSQADRVIAELRQRTVEVNGAAVIALRDRVLREADASKPSEASK